MSECHCPTLLCTALGGLYIQPLLSSSILQIIIRKYLNCGESVAWTGRNELCTLIPDPGCEADHHHGSDEDPVWSVWAYDALIVCVLLHNSRIRDFGALWQQERPAHFSKKSHFLVYSQGTNKSSLVILFFIGDGGIDHLKDLIGISYYYVDLFLPSWSRRCNVRILVTNITCVHPQASQDLVLIRWPGSRTNA